MSKIMEACSSFESDSQSPPRRGGDGEGGRNLRWELSFSILDCKENKKRILFDSPPLPIDASNNSYDWRDIHINLPEMSIMHRELITLHMYLHPIKENGERGRILWFTFCMQYTSLLFHMSAAEEAPFLFSHYDQFDTTTLNLLITGKVFYDSYNCRCSKFKIHHATLTTCAVYLQHLIELEQRFRIVCLAELSWRDSKSNKLQKAPLLYLSRPQRVQSINGKNRLYVWTMAAADKEGNKNQFQGLVQRRCHDWQKQVEDHNDLVRLRMEPPMTGAKQRSQTEAVFIPDNEAFTNASMAFPVHVKPGQTFTLKFFNMALDNCAKCGVEVVVKWNDYIHNASGAATTSSAMLLRKSGYKRFSLDFLYKQKHNEDVASTAAASKYQRMVMEAGVGLTVEIEYESNGNDLVTVYGVHLNVLNYHYTLQFLHLQALKSI
jgi:hypothetical protein